MHALFAGLLPGGSEWIILLIVAVLLFGGSRLAGIGKGTGRAIREFKEETKDLHSKDSAAKQVGTGKQDVDEAIRKDALDVEAVEQDIKNHNQA